MLPRHAHGVALRGDGSAFRRRVGAAESYVEQAAESSDLLVWQRTQDRDEDFSSPLQTLRPVSRVDYYDARPPFGTGQDKGDSTSLQRECSARARSGKSIHASRPFREMIARPEISRNEWEMAERGAFQVGNFALLSCPGSTTSTSTSTSR